jgi:hypothetical protein
VLRSLHNKRERRAEASSRREPFRVRSTDDATFTANGDFVQFFRVDY